MNKFGQVPGRGVHYMECFQIELRDNILVVVSFTASIV